MSKSSNDSNQLLRFMNEATSNIQVALSRQGNGKKVNHRKFIQKRLQRNVNTRSLPAKKSKPTSANTATAGTLSANHVMSNPAITRQPVATLPSTTPAYWQLSEQQIYHQPIPSTTVPSSIYQSSYTDSPFYSASLSQDYDPEIDSLLYEFGLDSPSHHSDIAVENRVSSAISQGSTTSSTAWEVPCYQSTSPLSDFSDIEDSTYSAYSSPRNPSPVCYSNSSSPQFCHQVATGSYEWSQMTYVPPVSSVPSSLSLNSMITPSLNDILELVTP